MKLGSRPMIRSLMIWIMAMVKGHKIGPARTLSSLSTAQVRMILRIYWTDRYQRRMLGYIRGTIGIRNRLARQFGVSIETIKKIVGIKHNQHGRRRRNRFKTISLASIQSGVKERLRKRGTPVQTLGVGRPRKEPRRSRDVPENRRLRCRQSSLVSSA